jgi:arginine deiminase
MEIKVTSEYGPLKKVLIHTPGMEHENSLPWEGEYPLLSSSVIAVEEAAKERIKVKVAH